MKEHDFIKTVMLRQSIHDRQWWQVTAHAFEEADPKVKNRGEDPTIPITSYQLSIASPAGTTIIIHMDKKSKNGLAEYIAKLKLICVNLTDYVWHLEQNGFREVYVKKSFLNPNHPSFNSSMAMGILPEHKEADLVISDCNRSVRLYSHSDDPELKNFSNTIETLVGFIKVFLAWLESEQKRLSKPV